MGKNAPFRIPQIVKRWCLVLDFRLRERDNQPFKMIAPYGFNPTCILLSAMSVALPLQAMKFELGPMGSLNRIEVQLRTNGVFATEGIRGIFSKVDGNIDFSVSQPAHATGKVSLDPRNLRFGYHRVDTDAQKKEWLNSAANPEISFQLLRLEDPRWTERSLWARAHGNLSIKGNKLAISLPVEIRYLRAERRKYDGRIGDLLLIKGETVLTREIIGLNNSMPRVIQPQILVRLNLVGASDRVRPLLPTPAMAGQQP